MLYVNQQESILFSILSSEAKFLEKYASFMCPLARFWVVSRDLIKIHALVLVKFFFAIIFRVSIKTAPFVFLCFLKL